MDSIVELFARDPFQLTDQDIDKIIEYNCQKRVENQLTGKAVKQPTAPVDLKALGLL